MLVGVEGCLATSTNHTSASLYRPLLYRHISNLHVRLILSLDLRSCGSSSRRALRGACVLGQSGLPSFKSGMVLLATEHMILICRVRAHACGCYCPIVHRSIYRIMEDFGAGWSSVWAYRKVPKHPSARHEFHNLPLSFNYWQMRLTLDLDFNYNQHHMKPAYDIPSIDCH
jgi:hypothetical protein